MNQNKGRFKIEISKEMIYFILLSLPHFHPDFLKTISILDTTIDMMRLVTFGIILFLYIRAGKFSNLIIFIFLTNLYIVIITEIYNGQTIGAIKSLFSIMALACLYELGLCYSSWIFIKSQLICYEILIYLNLFSILIFPNGLYAEYDALTRKSYVYKNFFLGYYTGNVKYYIGALVFSFLYAYICKKNIRLILLSAAALVSSVITNAGAGIITVAAMCLAYVALRKFPKLFNYLSYWSIQPVFYLVVIVVGFQNSLFQWIVNDVMHKSYSLNVRLNLWNNTRSLINKRLLFGYGIMESNSRQSLVGTAFGGYGHNLIIESLFKGGMLYVLLFIVVIFIVWKKISPLRYNNLTQIVSIAFLGWSINSLTDASANEFLIALFVLAYYIDYVILDSETGNLGSVFNS